jgi:hypothetical protein
VVPFQNTAFVYQIGIVHGFILQTVPFWNPPHASCLCQQLSAVRSSPSSGPLDSKIGNFPNRTLRVFFSCPKCKRALREFLEEPGSLDLVCSPSVTPNQSLANNPVVVSTLLPRERR